MKMKDALGNQIIAGRIYGYSRIHEDSTYIRVGKVTQISDCTVTFVVDEKRSVEHKNILKEDDHGTKPPLKSYVLFPIPLQDYQLGDRVTTEKFGSHLSFKVVGIRSTELELKGDWTRKIRKVETVEWYPTDQCHLKRSVYA